MANHGYLLFKKNLKKDILYQDLTEINNRRFEGLLSIKETDWDKRGSWFIYFHNKKYPDYPFGFNIWITSARRIEHRHPSGDFPSYLEGVFKYELALKYNASISDGGVSGSWKADEENEAKYFASSYKIYLLNKYPNSRDFLFKGKPLIDCILKEEKKMFPAFY